MKIGIFTDSHYSSQTLTCGRRYNSRSLEKIKKAVAAFKAEGCELIVCLGDLIDREENHQQEIQNLQAAASVLQSSQIRTICIMGNHDAFAFTPAEFAGISQLELAPAVVSKQGKHLVFLDTCYFSNGVHYAPGDTDWTDTFLPRAERLRELLSALQGEIWILTHQNLDPQIPQDHCLSNAEEVRRILKENGRVRGVWQGHYHPGAAARVNGIEYRTLPAMCERQEDFYWIWEI